MAISGEIERTPLPLNGMQTLYFGGGTPSLLSNIEITAIFQALKNKTSFQDIQEITLECNPEDIQAERLQLWKNLGITRLSLGLQSLNDIELQAMNRAHSASQSLESLDLITQFGGFEVSVDLIYGTPWKTNAEWLQELQLLLQHPGVHHISAYALTVEAKTQLKHQIDSGKMADLNDFKMIEQFEILQEQIQLHAWEAYEISNYCRPNHRAVHNSNYWKFVPYFGFGPAAHSFDGHKLRYMNKANNALYIKEIAKGILPRIEEILTDSDCLNERLMTGLRTCEGVRISDLTAIYTGWEHENAHSIRTLINSGKLLQIDGKLQLTKSGKLLSDAIISELMWVV